MAARVAYQPTETVQIDLHELHNGMFILIPLLINNSFDLCNSQLVYCNAEGSQFIYIFFFFY